MFTEVKAMKRLSIVITAFVLLTACASAPSEVQKENDVLDSASVADIGEVKRPSDSSSHSGDSKQSSIEYATMKEIRDSLDDVQKNNKTNVIVKSVRVGGGDSMPVYTPKKYNENYDDLAQIVEDMYGESYDKTKVQDGNQGKCYRTYLEEYEYDGTVQGKTIAREPMIMYTADGLGEAQELHSMRTGSFGICGKTKVDGEHRFPESQEKIKTYKLYAGEDPKDDSYVMTDGKQLRVADAVKCAEDFYNTYIAKLRGDGFTYKVNLLNVHRFDDGTHGFAYYMDLYDKNGNIHAGGIPVTNMSESYGRERKNWIYSDSFYGLTVDSKNEPYCFTGYNRGYDKVIDKGEKLISYQSALDIVASKLATSAMYELDSAVLEYVLQSPYVEGRIPYDKKEDRFAVYDPFGTYAADTPQVRPCWVFRDLKLNDPNLHSLGGVYIVDAITGELNVY